MRDKTEQKINQKNIYIKQITIKRIITKLKIKNKLNNTFIFWQGKERE
jgi:translation initiation factor IF-3